MGLLIRGLPRQGTKFCTVSLKKSHIYRYIMMPQALRVALPPTMNEFITLLKLTSLASIISLQELMTVTQINVARTFQFSEYYAVALTWYLVMVYCLMGLQKLVERRFRWSSRTEAAVLAETRRSRGW